MQKSEVQKPAKVVSPSKLLKVADRLWIGGPVKNENGVMHFWQPAELDVRSIATIILLAPADFPVDPQMRDEFDVTFHAITANGLLQGEMSDALIRLERVNADILFGQEEGDSVLIACDSATMEKSALVAGYHMIKSLGIKPVDTLAAIDALSDPLPERVLADDETNAKFVPIAEQPKERFVVLTNSSFRKLLTMLRI